jgi:hypothetical protein
MHWPDPARRQRIAEIRDNLIARFAEAGHEGWLGEADALTEPTTASLTLPSEAVPWSSVTTGSRWSSTSSNVLGRLWLTRQRAPRTEHPRD